ncbi:RidA family protein [Enterococcus rotai]|uniref:RidA family protein n=1 Tax=Enterococcus rotai TaxID=118060 RepID=UPI0035C6FE90
MKKIERRNPQKVPAPVGKYSHVTRVPKDAELIFLSGQVGMNQNQTFSEELNSQISQVFENIDNVMAAEKLAFGNVIKVNIWATEEIEWDKLDKEWDKRFSGKYPSMTIAYIDALGLSEIKIEIELIIASFNDNE